MGHRDCEQRRESCRKCKEWGKWKACKRPDCGCGRNRRPNDCDECKPRSCDCDECKPRRDDCGECKPRRDDCGDCKPRRRDCDCGRRDCNDCKPRRRDCDCGRRDCRECRDHGDRDHGDRRDCNDCGERRERCKCHEEKKPAGGLFLLKWSGRVTQTDEIVVAELADGGTQVDTPPSTPPEVNNRYVFASERCAKSISIRTHENTLSVQPAQVNVLIDGVVAFGLPVPTTPDKTLTRPIAIAIAAGHDLAVQVMLPPGDEEGNTLSLTVTIEFDDGSNGCCLVK